MGKVFRKAVLSVNEYQSGDGSVTVTSDRLRHWEDQFQRLKDAGYAVPMHWNHAELDDVEMLSPIAMDSLTRRDTRGAHNTEGRMVDFKVTPDGRSAEITVEILTPSAIEKVEANSVYVSPVIFPEFMDGHGNSYADVITSVDLVDYPVDHSQGPFLPAEVDAAIPALMGCGIRMGIKPTIFTPKVLRMDMASDTNMAAPAAPPGNEMNDGGSDADSIVKMIVDVMQEVGVQLPEDTSAANIVDNIRMVLGNGGQGGGNPDNGTVAVSPEIQTMSAIVRNSRAYAERAYHRELLGQLESLRDQGKILDEEFSLYAARVAAQRLSLDAYSKPKTGDVERFMDSRKVIPVGTFKTSTFRSGGGSKLARMSVAEPKNPEVLTPEREAYLLKLINGN
jgi:hypothetical protein